MTFPRLILLVCGIALAGFAFGAAPYLAPRLDRAIFGAVPVAALVAARGNLAGDEAATIALFEAASGSVASIATSATARNPFGRAATDVPVGAGSGFVWDDLGHIVTNAHVIRGATGATVRLAGGRSYQARLVGVDRTHDLAVLAIAAPGAPLTPLPLGSSADLRVGQKVFAIGNPFGLDLSLTTGIVSALDRELPEAGGVVITGLVQTDAAINPGNSGGPLLDSAGRLIGVNTAIYSPSGASAGIGFAIPVDTVNRIVPQLVATGRYDPPVIGIRADPRADAMMSAQTGDAGVMVLGVDPGSPAAAAGIVPARMTGNGDIVPGDVIFALDGLPLTTFADLRAALDLRNVGETVTLGLRSDSGDREVRVTLAVGSD